MKIFRIFPVFLVLCLLLSLGAPRALALDGPELSAQAVLLADLDSGAVLYARNADAQRSVGTHGQVHVFLRLAHDRHGLAKDFERVRAGR